MVQTKIERSMGDFYGHLLYAKLLKNCDADASGHLNAVDKAIGAALTVLPRFVIDKKICTDT